LNLKGKKKKKRGKLGLLFEELNKVPITPGQTFKKNFFLHGIEPNTISMIV